MGVPQLLRRLPPLSVTFLGKEISPVPVAKDLGVFIEKTLSYNEYISKTVSSCLYKLTLMNRIKHILDKKTFSFCCSMPSISVDYFIARLFGATLLNPT